MDFGKILTHGRNVGSAMIIVAGCVVAVAQAQTALTDADRVQRGLERSKQWCAHCHLVAQAAQTVAQAGVPSFESIAARPEQSVEKTENGILTPHPPMPDLQMSRDDVRDLALYIMSLKP